MRELIRHILRENFKHMLEQRSTKKLTTDEFIEKAKKVHGNKYNYEDVNYIGGKKDVKIICYKHGVFPQRPNNHLSGAGCPKCKGEKAKEFFKDTTESFIEKAKKIHGDLYDYSKVDYKGQREPIKIICNKHGVFTQKPSDHLQGNGCQKCGLEKMSEKTKGPRLDTKDFIERAKKVHGDKYDYSQTIYLGAIEPLKIICPIHGEFYQLPANHLNNNGCSDCSWAKLSTERRSNSQDFIKKAVEVHGKKYDYSKTNYERAIIPVTITCPKHGDFEQKPADHLNGNGCNACFLERNTLTDDDFIQRANEIHGNKYDYSKTDYTKGKNKVEIICPKHGPFFQQAAFHLKGGGCPSCSESKGERMIAQILTKLRINFERQKRFEDCVNDIKGSYCFSLPFDFYLPDSNTIIEYDGEQHFKPVEMWGGQKGFERRKTLDKIKNNYCSNKKIKLIRIPYTLNNIEEIEIYLNMELGLT